MQLKRRWDLLNTVFLTGTLALALVLVPLEFTHSLEHWGEWVVFLAMTCAVGLAVTCGYHRLFSHRAYRARWPVRLAMLCLGAAGFENSALQWASDHRLHHRHVDQGQDPYNSRKGFWYSHWIWVMEARTLPIAGVRDLEQDPLVRWQHRHPLLIGLCAAVLVPAAVGLWTHNLAGHLVIGLLLRVVVTHHTTFFINSAAHQFGTQPYSDAHSGRDNLLLAPLTYGEGYHNYHHTWQWDYRNGVKWYQWDPSKWLIRALAWTGLASGLRAVPGPEVRRARLAMEEKTLRARLDQAPPHLAEVLRTRLAGAKARLDQALRALQEHREAWTQRREAWAQRKAEWKAALAQHRRELRQAWGEWKAARLEVRRLRYAWGNGVG